MRKQVLSATAFVLLGVLLGALGTWVWFRGACDREIRTVALVHELHDAGFCVRILELIGEQRTDTAVEILESSLVSSLRGTGRLTSSGSVETGLVLPNIVDGAKRAQTYALARGLGGVTEVERSFERIGVSSERRELTTR